MNILKTGYIKYVLILYVSERYFYTFYIQIKFYLGKLLICSFRKSNIYLRIEYTFPSYK